MQYPRLGTAQVNQTISTLVTKLERQQLRQSRYIGKIKRLNRSIKKTSRLVGYHASLLSEMTAPPVKGRVQSAKRSAPFDSDARARQRSRFTIHPDAEEEAELGDNNQDPATTPITPTTRQRIVSKTPFPKIIPRPRRNNIEIAFGSMDKMDTLIVRHKQQELISTKKPRSLLYNIADNTLDRGINDLMITTSLDGELQFWSASEKRKIKTIGKDHLYDSWIDDICWATPKTLAFCPSQKSNEPLKLVHVVSVTKTNVEGRIQTLQNSPHENGVSVIGSLDTGSYSSPNSETCSFVTGGYDKSVYLWSLHRESPDDDFTLKGTHRLNIKHTSALYSLCYDKFKNILFSGGSDERLTIFDLQSNTSLRELRLTQRVSQIIQSKANPNIVLITTTNRSDQFAIYDQRIPGFDGIKLRFGQMEQETLSRFTRPDMHENGYTVCCGGQAVPKLNFWDLRYSGVHRSPSFSLETHAKTRILRSLFIPHHDTIATLSSSRSINWFDYSIKKDEIVKSLI
ncbi:WD40-repeat-containing domain protein [Thamnidium elegans]|nr:WD40-repeat-containing domain protein [Thamnidium elegans]